MEWIRRMRLGLGRRIGTIGVLGASIALGLCAPCAIAQMNDISLQDITRLRGHGSDRLWGIGLVMGLGNSGDSNDVLPKARQIAQLLQHAGSPIPGIDEAMRTRSVAIVMVSVRLPEEGVVVGDEFHLDVQTMFDAKSLQGGNLFLTPMRGAMPGDPYIYAMGAGKVTIEGSTPTSARVSNGCRIIRDIEKPVISNHGTLTLQVRENYASHTTTTLIANLINQDRQGLRADGMAPIARAYDDRSVVVEIPEEELENPVRFIADLQKITFDESLLHLRPRIVINEAAGLITITGNVVIRPSVLTSGRLVVTTIEPDIPATLENPRISQSNSTMISTSRDQRAVAQAQALLEAMRRLEVPVQEQIQMFRTLEQSNGLSVPLEFQ